MEGKLLFCARYFVGVNQDHLARKFSGEIAGLTEVGYEVYYIGIDHAKIGLYKKDKLIEQLDRVPNIKIQLLSNMLLYKRLNNAYIKAIRKIEGLSFIYARVMFPIYSSKKVLRYSKNKGIFNIMEIPTYPPELQHKQEKRFLRKLGLVYVDTMKSRLARYVDCYTLIGENANEYMRRPAVNISNGIDISKIPIISKHNENDKEVHLIAVSAMTKFQGYERLIEGLKEYYSSQYDKTIYFHLVGNDADGSLQKWINMADVYGVKGYVIAHGARYGEELTSLFNISDIAVASLIGKNQVLAPTTLKICEYTARGIPFIGACDALILNEMQDLGFFLFVDDNNKPIDLKSVLAFMEKCSRQDDLSKRMHLYAEKNMTWKKQFEIMDNYIISKKLLVKRKGENKYD